MFFSYISSKSKVSRPFRRGFPTTRRTQAPRAFFHSELFFSFYVRNASYLRSNSNSNRCSRNETLRPLLRRALRGTETRKDGPRSAWSRKRASSKFLAGPAFGASLPTQSCFFRTRRFESFASSARRDRLLIHCQRRFRGVFSTEDASEDSERVIHIRALLY